MCNSRKEALGGHIPDGTVVIGERQVDFGPRLGALLMPVMLHSTSLRKNVLLSLASVMTEDREENLECRLKPLVLVSVLPLINCVMSGGLLRSRLSRGACSEPIPALHDCPPVFWLPIRWPSSNVTWPCQNWEVTGTVFAALHIPTPNPGQIHLGTKD